MTVQELIDMLNEIEDKTIDIKDISLLNPFLDNRKETIDTSDDWDCITMKHLV